MSDWFHLVAERLPQLWLRTGEHIVLTGISTLVAVLIGIPLGILASRIQWLKGTITGVVGTLQTIPSLAMLAFLLAMMGRIGAQPALIALALYALLPIVRNTIAGIEGVAAPIIEAAEGIGMTRTQRLWIVELPLAAPVIITGIRSAAVVGVGIATLSAFVGAGGLGQFINRGLSLSNNQLILLGAIPSALLALLVDASIGRVQWAIQRRRTGDTNGPFTTLARVCALASPAVILACGFLAVYGPRPGGSLNTFSEADNPESVVTIGSKNFTEQLILGEILAQLIEHETDLQVIRKFNLGGTMICHGALLSGGIDLYVEYSGTALTAILGEKASDHPDQALSFLSREYDRQFDLVWLKPFGFNNTYALAVRNQDAREKNLQSISDLQSLAPELRAGWTFEFSERPDGFPGLAEEYGLRFARVRDLETSLLYEAIARQEVDVISAFATDGRIAAFDLMLLEDDKQFFPPYEAAPVLRADTLKKHPELESLLNSLASRITDETMQGMNFAVDQDKRSPREVAREFLLTEQLISNGSSSR